MADDTKYNIGFIGKYSKYETPYYVFNGVDPGPIVLLEAGIHGDEVAGVYALEQLLPKIKVHAGKLVIFPRMNLPACEANKRFINVDLNLIFPGSNKHNHYEYSLALEIFNMVKREGVEYVLTLHESRNLHDKKKPKTFGQTIVYGVKPTPSILSKWLSTISKFTKGNEAFYGYYYPVENSSTEIFMEKLHLKGGFCIETWRGFDLKRRIELQRIVVLTFLDLINIKYSI